MIWPDGDPSESLMDHLYQVTIIIVMTIGHDNHDDHDEDGYHKKEPRIVVTQIIPP